MSAGKKRKLVIVLGPTAVELEDKIMMYVNVIRRIDNRTRWEILTHGRMNILEAMIINKLFALT